MYEITFSVFGELRKVRVDYLTLLYNYTKEGFAYSEASRSDRHTQNSQIGDCIILQHMIHGIRKI